MTRLELLTIVVGRARGNGFEFRRWYTSRLGIPWISAEASLKLLDQQRRYYALLFSHEFANAFWKAGEEITFSVPSQSFQRPMPDGSIKTVHRQGFMRRSARRDAWKYHLREMALAEPVRGGFDTVAWIGPFAFLLLGIILILLLLRLWKKRHDRLAPVVEPATPDADALRNRIRDETNYGE